MTFTWAPDRKLFGAAAGMALLALIAAAADVMTLAGRLLLLAAGIAAAAGLLQLYTTLPVEGQTRMLSREVAKGRAALSLLLAIAVSCAYWFVGYLPLPNVQTRLLLPLWRGLDFVPSAFSFLFPAGWRSGFHHHFNDMTYCFPGPFWWESMHYLRTAIPAHALTFFAAFTLWRLARAAFRDRILMR